jgi:phosphopantothenoylcysteine synthetase/decarboxylase
METLQALSGKTVVLGVCGSIAAYRSADIASQLVKMGASVHVVMSPGATRFITPLTLQTLSRNPVVTSDSSGESNWVPLHIALADSADLLLIAPASANVIAELANGLASHPLTEIALAARCPVLIAPAMNGKMWNHPATVANRNTLSDRGAHFVGPSSGSLACGYEGEGRLSEVTEILWAAQQCFA